MKGKVVKSTSFGYKDIQSFLEKAKREFDRLNQSETMDNYANLVLTLKHLKDWLMIEDNSLWIRIRRRGYYRNDYLWMIDDIGNNLKHRELTESKNRENKFVSASGRVSSLFKYDENGISRLNEEGYLYKDDILMLDRPKGQMLHEYYFVSLSDNGNIKTYFLYGVCVEALRIWTEVIEKGNISCI